MLPIIVIASRPSSFSRYCTYQEILALILHMFDILMRLDRVNYIMLAANLSGYCKYEQLLVTRKCHEQEWHQRQMHEWYTLGQGCLLSHEDP